MSRCGNSHVGVFVKCLIVSMGDLDDWSRSIWMSEKLWPVRPNNAECVSESFLIAGNLDKDMYHLTCVM